MPVYLLYAYRCTLILTEGDSAKTLAVAGLSVIGRDHYGVFPLRGKLLNVREATPKQVLNTETAAKFCFNNYVVFTVLTVKFKSMIVGRTSFGSGTFKVNQYWHSFTCTVWTLARLLLLVFCCSCMFISSSDYGQCRDQQYHKDSGSAVQV